MVFVKRKILHIINGEYYSGAEKVQDLLAEQLETLGYSISFLALKEGVFEQKRKYRNSSLLHLPMKSKFDLTLAFEIGALVKKENYLLIHTHTPRAALVGRGASFCSGVPMVHHVHSPTMNCTENYLRNIVNHWGEKVGMIGAEKLIAVSHSLKKNLLRQGFSAGKVHFVSNGVPCRETLIKRKSPGSEFVFGIVALFRPRKGLETLLKALELIKQNGSVFRLKAVGPFETEAYETKIKNMAKKLGVEDDIEWVGFTSEVDHEFDLMDVMVLPSLHGEGMPMVVLEALASGVPVIGASVEGIPEVVRNGEDGIIFEPGNVEQLAVAMQGFINGEYDWSLMRDKAIKWHAKSFSDVMMARQVSLLYEEILKNGQNS